jgi:hypothetical protein
VKIDPERPNESRADLGAIAIHAAGVATNVIAQESVRTTIIDVLAYVAHLCDRVGLAPEGVFENALGSYEGDMEDGPHAHPIEGFDAYEQKWDELPTQPDPDAIVLCIRDPDYENDYTVVGAVRIIDIDLGRGFDGGKGFRALDPEDREEYIEGWRAEVADLPEDHLIRQQVEAMISQLHPGW